MGQRLGKIGYVDNKFELTLEKIKEKLFALGIDNISDRQASRIVSDIFESLEFDITIKSKKRKDKIEINMKKL